MEHDQLLAAAESFIVLCYKELEKSQDEMENRLTEVRLAQPSRFSSRSIFPGSNCEYGTIS